MGKMASVARGKGGGSFNSSPKSAAKSHAMLAGTARGGAEGTTGASEARSSGESVPSQLRGAGKMTDQTAHDMPMQKVPAANSESPNRPTPGKKTVPY